MITPDAHQYRALNMLNTSELAPIVDYLKARRSEVLERIATQSDAQVIARLQGEAQFIKGFCEDIAQASARRDKLMRPPTNVLKR